MNLQTNGSPVRCMDRAFCFSADNGRERILELKIGSYEIFVGSPGHSICFHSARMGRRKKKAGRRLGEGMDPSGLKRKS